MPTRRTQGTARRQHRRPAPNTANARMLQILHSAQQSQPSNFVVRPGGPGEEDRVLISKHLSAVAGLTDFLSFGAELSSIVDEDGHVTLDPPHQDAGRTITVDAAMTQSSRVLSAGATLIQGAEMHQEIPVTGGGTILARSAISLSTFEPMKFDHVAMDWDPETDPPEEEPELQLSPVPFKTQEVDLDAFQQYGVAIRLTRRQIKDVSPDRLSMQVLWPLIQGLGRAIDAEFFRALAGMALPEWALGDAAAQGLTFEGLNAIIGTDGIGAITENGKLYAGGIPARLTADTSSTFVGSFDRAAIVTDEDIKIVATRTDASGGVEIACWVGLQALIPDAGKFWQVPAPSPEEPAPEGNGGA